jgi:coenzyme PQQ precursor peptide PqqA
VQSFAVAEGAIKAKVLISLALVLRNNNGAKIASFVLLSLMSEAPAMKWVRPKFEEISLKCEINSYANAEN